MPPTKTIVAAAAVLFAWILAAGPAAAQRSGDDERRARGEVLVCRFAGEFVASGLPDQIPDLPAQAILLDLIEARFLLVVRVHEIQEGELPAGWSDKLAFAIHSPALFFGGQGISLPAGSHHPPGRYVFSLWRLPDSRRFKLDVRASEGTPL
jgi:hypothetical protein